jgi:hypothetical protein
VEPGEFLDQGQPDPGPLMSAPVGPLDAMESLEEVGQLIGRDADPGILHAEFERISIRMEGDRDSSRLRVLECIRQQVQDDLLPHVAVDVGGLGRGRAIDDELHAGPLDGRAEDARQIGRQGGQVRRLVDRLDAARLDPLGLARRKRLIRLREGILGGAEHQRQRRAELMADVREEGGLGTVQLGEGLRSLVLLIIGLGVGDAGRDLALDQVDEPAVVVVEGPERIQAGDQDARSARLPRGGDGHGDRLMRRPIPGARG